MSKKPEWIEPDAAQRERLDLLIEECAEVIQIASKVRRFGYEEYYEPEDATNRERLELEIGDVFFAVQLLVSSGDLSALHLDDAFERKRKKVAAYTKHQREALDAYDALRREKAGGGR